MIGYMSMLITSLCLGGTWYVKGVLKGMKRESAVKKNYRGKIVWITGASSGIGRALAIEFSKSHAVLILSGRNLERLRETQKACAECWPDPEQAQLFIKIIELDLDEDTEELQAKAAEALSAFPTSNKIDVFINNAGISSRGSVIDTDIDTIERMMQVNFTAPVTLIKAILPSMMDKKQGQIIAISSVQGLVAMPYRSPYCASKHALQGFMDSLRAEVTGNGLKVLCVSPGWVRTELSKNALDADGNPVGKIDANGASGMKPEYLAKLVVEAGANGDNELIVSQLSGHVARYLRTLVPDVFFWVMDKRGRKLQAMYSKNV